MSYRYCSFSLPGYPGRVTSCS